MLVFVESVFWKRVRLLLEPCYELFLSVIYFFLPLLKMQKTKQTWGAIRKFFMVILVIVAAVKPNSLLLSVHSCESFLLSKTEYQYYCSLSNPGFMGCRWHPLHCLSLVQCRYQITAPRKQVIKYWLLVVDKLENPARKT